MSIKNLSRLRRAKKTRSNIRNQESPRLTVYRSSKHFYAQIFDSLGSKVIVSASTTEKDLKIKSNNLDGVTKIGQKLLKERLKVASRKLFLIDLVINIMAELKLWLIQQEKQDWSFN